MDRTIGSTGAAPATFVARPGRSHLHPAQDPARWSRLAAGTFLVHADLHNHTMLSDGEGDPIDAFLSMRRAGLDVAALTDHARIGWSLPVSPCGPHGGPAPCASLVGIDHDAWERVGRLTKAADDPGAFVALRGFEWSGPSLGHMNVWFSRSWIDPLTTGGVSAHDRTTPWIDEAMSYLDPVLRDTLDDVFARAPAADASMRGFYDWFAAPPEHDGLSGGLDGLASFNHPGRDGARFGGFGMDPRMRGRVVAIEAFNRDEDYLFEGTDLGEPSPIVQCLNAGWTVGLSGVSDEHGAEWGFRNRVGRTGLWVRSLDRSGIRQAMLGRRFFATRVPGLRMDAAANAVPMGGRLALTGGQLRIELDVDRGPAWTGKRLLVQALAAGERMPTILASVEMRVPKGHEQPFVFKVDLRGAETGWLVLRVSDPDLPADPRATGAFAEAGEAVAYASPFFLGPAPLRAIGVAP